MKKDTKFLLETLITHRGMHDSKKGIPENSIIAFERSVEHNYIIEMDLHILKDNSVVVFHDDNLKRMTGIDKHLSETTYEEIKDLKLQNTDNYIPLFKDVLEVISGKVPIVIELKYDAKFGLLERETMNILKDYKGEYAIQSFNPLTVYWFKRKYPNVIRGQLASEFKNHKISLLEKLVLKNMLFNIFTKPDFISYDINGLKQKSVQKYMGKKTILGWTVRTKEEKERAEKYCDNLICDNVEEL